MIHGVGSAAQLWYDRPIIGVCDDKVNKIKWTGEYGIQIEFTPIASDKDAGYYSVRVAAVK